ncbi:MAG: hypothetical protein K0Q84_1404 [Arthrobacter sp.]|nr:hypothetical protein [Arthrobacter sp.]
MYGGMMEQIMEISLRAASDNLPQAHGSGGQKGAANPQKAHGNTVPSKQKPRRFAETTGFFCALDRIRTYGLLLRRQTLYPLSYEGIQGSCRYRLDVLELSRKVGSNGKSGHAACKLKQRPGAQPGPCSVPRERVHLDPPCSCLPGGTLQRADAGRGA